MKDRIHAIGKHKSDKVMPFYYFVLLSCILGFGLTTTMHKSLSLIKLWNILAFLSTCSLCLAQGHNYVNYTVDDGLPSNAIYGAVQDEKNNIWIYTEKGIAKFNGYDFEVYTVKDGLPINDIWSIVEDKTGRLWINCFSEDVFYIENDSIKKFVIINLTKEQKKPGLQHNNFVEENGETVVHSPISNTYFKLKKGTDTLFLVDMPAERQCIDSQIHTPPYSLRKEYFTDFADVYAINLGEDSWEAFPSPKRNLKKTKGNSKMVMKADILCYYPDYSWIFFFKPENQQSLIVDRHFFPNISRSNSLRFEYSAGHFQINDNERLLVLDKDLKVVDNLIFGNLTDYSIANAMKDRNGNYWIATKHSGLFFLSQQSRNTEQLTSKESRIEVINGYGNKVVAGSSTGEIFLYENQRLERLESFNQKDRVRTISFANEEKFIVGYDFDFRLVEDGQNRGYSEFPINYITSKRTEGFKHAISLKCSLYDKDGSIFLGTRDGFLRLEKKDSLNIYTLNYNRTTAIEKIQDTYWFGTPFGLGKWTKEGGDVFPATRHTILQKCVNALAKDSYNRLWVATDGYGLFCYDRGKVYPVSTKQKIINTLFIDSLDRLWVGTNKGVDQLKIYENLEDIKFINNLGPNDGLPTNEILSLYVNRNKLFVGTTQGMVLVNLDFPYKSNTAPNLFLQKILVNNQERSIDDLKDLKHYENKIEISYNAISYKSHRNILYEVTRKDKSNPRFSSDRKLTLPKQPPGNYAISIRAMDIEETFSKDVLEFSINISPPWWNTLLFKTAVVLIFIFSVISLVLFRLGRVKNREKQKGRLNKKFAELELNALQSQMNPHFVFNSLGAIQYYINKNNVEKADEYLSQFAYLMRLFLESSKNRYISLEQEIKLVRHYVYIEQLRFPKKIDFNLEIASDLKPYSTQIPSMLLQPFLENSINHGIFHKDKKGHLSVRISQKGQRIFFTIEDDGIGRVAAQKIKHQSKRNYVSRGMQIVKDRINTINLIENCDIVIEIEDLYTNEDASGTRVTVSLDVIKNTKTT